MDLTEALISHSTGLTALVVGSTTSADSAVASIASAAAHSVSAELVADITAHQHSAEASSTMWLTRRQSIRPAVVLRLAPEVVLRPSLIVLAVLPRPPAAAVLLTKRIAHHAMALAVLQLHVLVTGLRQLAVPLAVVRELTRVAARFVHPPAVLHRQHVAPAVLHLAVAHGLGLPLRPVLHEPLRRAAVAGVVLPPQVGAPEAGRFPLVGAAGAVVTRPVAHPAAGAIPQVAHPAAGVPRLVVRPAAVALLPGAAEAGRFQQILK